MRNNKKKKNRGFFFSGKKNMTVFLLNVNLFLRTLILTQIDSNECCL